MNALLEQRPFWCGTCCHHFAENFCDLCGAFPLPLVKDLTPNTTERAPLFACPGEGARSEGDDCR